MQNASTPDAPLASSLLGPRLTAQEHLARAEAQLQLLTAARDSAPLFCTPNDIGTERDRYHLTQLIGAWTMDLDLARHRVNDALAEVDDVRLENVRLRERLHRAEAELAHLRVQGAA